MDISMPVMNGLEATKYLRQRIPAEKVLILTMQEKKEFTSQIIQSGAQGYVPKTTSPTELVRAIESIHRGETFFGSQVSNAFLKDYVEKAGQVEAQQRPA